MSRFIKRSYNADSDTTLGQSRPPAALRSPALPILGDAFEPASFDPPAPSRPAGWNDESAAREYAEAVLADAGSESLAALVAPERAEVVPDLKTVASSESRLTGNRRVDFQQTAYEIPIFGTRAVVEIDGTDRRFVSMDLALTDTPDVSPVAQLSAQQALAAVADYTNTQVSALEVSKAPRLEYFLDEEADQWHLVYHLESLNAIPPSSDSDAGYHGAHFHAASPRIDLARYDYLVSANNGEIVFFYSSSPLLIPPVACRGIDEDGNLQTFDGTQLGAGSFVLSDPLRRIDTIDQGGADIQTTPTPSNPIGHTTTHFAQVSTAGVSAHVAASRVFDFFNDVLKRNGIDDRGMRLRLMVNCTYAPHGLGPAWPNAVWWNGRMWFGQTANGNGPLKSYARHLDIVAHELTHGVTEYTSNLIYKNQSGALNESFSDIFAILVKNWFPGEPNPISGWSWQLSPGLGANGGPLRDLQNPAALGHPDHMNHYVHTTADHGGVHTNSNIHNKAAFNLLTAADSAGNPFLSPGEIALLYYVTLSRLNSMADFSDCRRVLLSVATTRYQGDPDIQAKLTAITDAYDNVGIT